MKIIKRFRWILFLSIGGLLLALILFFLLDYQQEPLVMNSQARSEAAGEFIQLSQGTTHYRLLGPPEGELVVLIHGGMVSGMYAWDKNYQVLVENGYRVLKYDLYGRGYSDRLEVAYTPELFFGQFEELLDSLAIKEPFYLAGLSLGSMPAIDYTARHPEQVKKLMLISPAARGLFNLHPLLEVPLLSDFLMTVYWQPRAIDQQMKEFYKPENFQDYKEELKKMVRYEGYKDSNYSTWIHTLTYSMEPFIRQIAKEGTPVALVLGAHDPYLAPDEANIYQEMIPELEVFIIDEAGHVVNFEKPEEVNKLMLNFFQPSDATGSAEKN
ncbi:alpha/beta fold hydrolase [Nafulsella turpanensis]|uniref:alpha/beta fold hydrolase n=1 Tax=Nafulsella turpanensis TaxID=1265690 RepID=UPI0003454BE2|nr:alpha/beta hydrolase [Nafulsella turpanensis]